MAAARCASAWAVSSRVCSATRLVVSSGFMAVAPSGGTGHWLLKMYRVLLVWSRYILRYLSGLVAVVVVGRHVQGQVQAGVGEGDDLDRQRAGRPLGGVHPALVQVPADDRADLVPHCPHLLRREEGQGLRRPGRVLPLRRPPPVDEDLPDPGEPAVEPDLLERARRHPRLLGVQVGRPESDAQRLRRGLPRALPAAAAAGLLDEAVLRERP